MDKGELNLYRDTFEAGRKAGMEELAEKLKEEIKSKDAVMILSDEVQQIIDKYLKEALTE